MYFIIVRIKIQILPIQTNEKAYTEVEITYTFFANTYRFTAKAYSFTETPITLFAKSIRFTANTSCFTANPDSFLETTPS